MTAWTIWLIGALFTLGFIEDSTWRTLFTWPADLGEALRNHLNREK